MANLIVVYDPTGRFDRPLSTSVAAFDLKVAELSIADGLHGATIAATASRLGLLLLEQIIPPINDPPLDLVAEGTPVKGMPDVLNSALDGHWTEEGQLELTSEFYDEEVRVYNALEQAASVSLGVFVFRAELKTWTSQQRKLAAEWALSAYAETQGYRDVVVPPRPDFIERMPF